MDRLTIYDLLKEFKWLKTNRKFRIENSIYPNSIERVEKNTIEANNKKITLIQLIRDIKSIENRIEKTRNSYNKRYFNEK